MPLASASTPSQGIGAGFVTDIFARSKDVVDEVMQVSGPDAIAMAKKLGLVRLPRRAAAV